MKVQVPTNVNIRKEIWKGLSYKDAFKLLMVISISGLIAMIYVSIAGKSSMLWCTTAFLLGSATTFVFLKRVEGLTPYEIIKLKMKYQKEQQRFLYKKEDLWQN